MTSRRGLLSKFISCYYQQGLAGAVRIAARWLTRRSPAILKLIVWTPTYQLNPRCVTGHPPRHRSGSPSSAYDSIRHALEELGIGVEPVRIDVRGYQSYMENAAYPPNYPEGRYSAYLPEKSLEHFLSAKFLELKDDDVLRL